MKNVIEKYTFDNYIANEQWQCRMKQMAIDYAKDPDGWFALLGQTGAGKTHLCTAVMRELIHRGNTAKYFIWEDDSRKLKSLVNDAEYNEMISEIKNVDVLYIDDLFKSATLPEHNHKVSDADIRLAFEIAV